MPTCVGLRYGQSYIWLEAFLGSIGAGDFCALANARPMDQTCGNGICLISVLSHGSPPCPFDGFTFLTASPLHSSRCSLVQEYQPACHRLRLRCPRLRTRLTLGRLTLPRKPQAFGVCDYHTDCATHSGILTSRCSTSPRGLASPLENAPLPWL